jgi:peptide/nickel transport system substrate-binding protein
MKRLVLLTLLAAVALALCVVPLVARAESPSASPYAQPAATAEGKLVYKLGITQSYDGFNPFAHWSGPTWDVFRLCYNFLTWYDDDYEPVPDLATKWSTSPDGKVWTFTIRDGMKWSDGVPLTAHDIAYTYNRILDTQHWAYIQYFVGVKKVEAPDDTTLVITCDQPSVGMLALYVPILPEHVWKNVADKDLESYRNMPIVGSGPFIFSEAKTDKWVKLVPNPEYPKELGGPPKLDEFWYIFSQNMDSMVQDYKAGNLDAIVDWPASYYNDLKSQPGTSVSKSPAIGFVEMGINCYDDPSSKGNPLLLDVAIRQAMNYAIDKQSIVDTSMGGLAPVATSLISPVQGVWHWDVPEDQQYTYDPEKAKQMLEDAGYTDTDGDGVREDAKGNKLEFRFSAFNEYPEQQAAAKKIAAYLDDVGIKMKLDMMDESAFSDRYYSNADGDTFIWSWRGDIDPGFMLSTFTTEQILNWGDSNYSNPEYDQLYNDQLTALNPEDPTDPTKRAEIVHQMQQILYRDSPYIILWYNINLQAWRTDKWTGYHHVPTSGGGAPFFTLTRGTYQELAPVAAETTEEGGSNTGLIVGIVIAVVVVAAIVIWLIRRPKKVEVE